MTTMLRQLTYTLALGSLLGVSAHAQLFWLDGNANNDWDFTELNWEDSNNTGVPITWSNGNTARFTANLGETVNLDTNVIVDDLQFQGPNEERQEGEYVISGTGSITLTGNLRSNVEEDNNGGGGSGINTINVDMILDGGGFRSFAIRRNGGMVINGDISESNGSAEINLQRISNNGQDLTLTGDNTFSGGISLTTNGSTLRLGSATALGTGTVETGSSSTIDNVSGGDLINTNNNELSLNNLEYIGTDSFDFGTGDVTLTNNSDIDVTEVGATFTLGGNISDDGDAFNLTKQGDGILALSGNSTFTGDVFVNGGTMTLLAGSEMLFDLENLSMSNSFQGDSTVIFNGLFVLDTGTLTDEEGLWNLVDVDLLTETFGGSFGLEFANGDIFTTADAGLTWTFDAWTFDTTTGNLSLVPEPTSAAFLGAAGLLLLARRKRA